MLNLLVMVIRNLTFLGLILLKMIFAAGPLLQIFSPPEITSPNEGEILQGQVSVLGNTDVDGFISYEISFTYEQEGAENWFLITYSSEPVANSVLAVWDTTVITDGNYKLRLIVEQEDGRRFEEIIKNLRVRNYSSIETETPAAGMEETLPTEPVFQLTREVANAPRPTNFPNNPAEIHSQDLVKGILWGITGVVVLFGLFFLYFVIKKNGRR